jgi:exosortase
MEKLGKLIGRLKGVIRLSYQQIFAAILIGVLLLIVYGRDLEIVANEALQNEAFNHVLLMPFFAGFLFYLKRDLVRASMALEKYHKATKAKYVDTVVGVCLCIASFLIYWYGSYTFYPLEYHLLSLPIFIMGITLVLFSLKTLLVLIFPVLFLLFIVPMPSEYLYTVGGSMANLNTQASYALLKTFSLPVNLSSSYGPPAIELTTSMGRPASFTIDLPCSGIYSLIAFAMFAAFIGFISTASILKKVGVVLFGFFVFDLLNIVRITMIICIAYWFGEDLAMLVFHTVAGLILIFVGMLITLLVSERLLKIRILAKSQEQQPCPKCTASAKELESFCLNCGRFFNLSRASVSKTTIAKILLLLLGCSLVTFTLNAPTFAVAQGPIGVSATSNWENATNILPTIQDYRLMWGGRDTYYEKLAHQDASVTYYYVPTNSTKSVVYVLVNVASSFSNLHSWEVCLITWQTAQGAYPLVKVLDSKDTQILQDVPIIARYLVFISPYNYTQVTLYWYEKATFRTALTVEQKYVRISLVILTQNSSNYGNLENELLPIGQSVASYWEPLKYQSLVSLGVPAQQSLLAASAVFIALTKVTQYASDQRKKRSNTRIFSNFAPEEEKRVLETIQEIAKTRKTMKTEEIRVAFNERTGKSMNTETLLTILATLENYGFLKRDIVSANNRPVLIWKA